MFFCEAEPVYEIFEAESVRALFSERFSDVRPAWLRLLLEIVEQYYAAPGNLISSESIPACRGLSERQLDAALRYWTRAGLLRKAVSRPVRYKLTDPVPLDEKQLLRYVPFARRISEECGEIRTLLPYEIQLVWAWKTYPGLPEEVILETARTVLELNPDRGLKSAEKLLPYVQDAADRQEARIRLSEYRSHYLGTQEIRRILGLTGDVSDSDMTYYVTWNTEWGFSFDDIRLACRAAAQGDPSFPYLNGILRNIRDSAPESGSADGGNDINVREDSRIGISDHGLNNEGINHNGITDKEIDPKEEGRTAAAMNLTRELREILRLAGGGRITGARAAEYQKLRDEFGYEKVQLAARLSGEEGRGFDGIGKLLSRWSSMELNSMDEILQYQQEIRKEKRLLAELYRIWEIERAPGARDRRLVRQWLAQYSEDLILKAAEYAGDAEDPPLYTAKVLHRYKEKGIATPEQAELDAKSFHSRS